MTFDERLALTIPLVERVRRYLRITSVRRKARRAVRYAEHFCDMAITVMWMMRAR